MLFLNGESINFHLSFFRVDICKQGEYERESQNNYDNQAHLALFVQGTNNLRHLAEVKSHLETQRTSIFCSNIEEYGKLPTSRIKTIVFLILQIQRQSYVCIFRISTEIFHSYCCFIARMNFPANNPMNNSFYIYAYFQILCNFDSLLTLDRDLRSTIYNKTSWLQPFLTALRKFWLQSHELTDQQPL